MTISDAPINAYVRLALAKVIHERLGPQSIPGAIDGVCEDLLLSIINTPVSATRVDSEGFTYTGEFVMGMRHGKGKSTHPDPDKNTYIGHWENDVHCGKGKEYSEGSYKYSYEGDFMNNKRDGWGIAKNQEHTYKGNFKNDYYHGYGDWKSTIEFPLSWDVLSYKGYWVQGNYSGKGIKECGDGRIYKGDFVCGLAHGQCKIMFPDFDNTYEDIDDTYGCTYEGSFREGRSVGLGTWTHCNGLIRTGMWHETTQWDASNTEELQDMIMNLPTDLTVTDNDVDTDSD